jgi:hypothetical protein
MRTAADALEATKAGRRGQGERATRDALYPAGVKHPAGPEPLEKKTKFLSVRLSRVTPNFESLIPGARRDQKCSRVSIGIEAPCSALQR